MNYGAVQKFKTRVSEFSFREVKGRYCLPDTKGKRNETISLLISCIANSTVPDLHGN